MDELGLAGLLDTPVRQLSLGERMRGEVAAALLHRPRLLVLDEPTIGLDMISKERLRQFLIAERARAGMTLLLTTHDMGDIERLCERVLVVDRGRLVYDGTLPGLAERVALQRVLVVDLTGPQPPLRGARGGARGSELDGLRQRLAFSPEQDDGGAGAGRGQRAGRGAGPDAGGAGHRGHRPHAVLRASTPPGQPPAARAAWIARRRMDEARVPRLLRAPAARGRCARAERSPTGGRSRLTLGASGSRRRGR